MIDRKLVGSLSLSALAFVGILTSEGFSDKATIPTKNDVPTVGFGTTVYQDGKKVALGDKIQPVRAIVEAHNHLAEAEKAFKQSIDGVAISQAEYDVYLDFVYQYGIGSWRNSSMRKHLLSGQYAEACGALLLWKFAGGYDCSTLINGKPNTRCYGVWTRQLERHKKCMDAQP